MQSQADRAPAFLSRLCHGRVQNLLTQVPAPHLLLPGVFPSAEAQIALGRQCDWGNKQHFSLEVTTSLFS